MITTTTTAPDRIGYGRHFEIAPGVFRDAGTGDIVISDGVNALVVRVTDPAAQD